MLPLTWVAALQEDDASNVRRRSDVWGRRSLRRTLLLAAALWLAAAAPLAAARAQAAPQQPAATPQRPAGAANQGQRPVPADSGDTAAADTSAAMDSSEAAGAAAQQRSADSSRAAAARRGILGDLSLVQAIIALALVVLSIVLATGALRLFERYGEMVRNDESLGVTSHWGGFGGGASGWRASPALSILVSAIILLGGATTVALTLVARVLPGVVESSSTAETPGNTPGDTPGN
jgi:hypothetical protein